MNYSANDNHQLLLPNVKRLQENTLFKRLENPPTGVPRYTINDEGYFSVTQILDDGKYEKIDQRILTHSQVLGSVVHLQIENFLKSNELHLNLDNALEENQLKLFNFLPYPSDEDWNTYVQNPLGPDNSLEELVLHKRIDRAFDHFKEFYDNHELKVIFSEEIIWNPLYLYAGTVDLLCLLDGKLSIIDFKTSRFVDESETSLDNYTGQLSAYLQAINTLENQKVNIDLKILHLDPLKGTFKMINRKNNFSVFLKALTRFSQTKFVPKEPDQNQKSEKELSEQFFDKKFSCPDGKCKEQSTFPFAKKNDFLIENQVKRIVKVAFHESANHHAVYHIRLNDLVMEKSFISENKI